MAYYVYINKVRCTYCSKRQAYYTFHKAINCGASARILDGKTGKIIAEVNKRQGKV